MISEIKYLGGGTLDFIEVRIPDDYPDPENLVLVIYDRTHNGSTSATPSAVDMYAIESVGDTSDDTTADGITHFIIGTDYDGTQIRLHAQDAVGLYNSVTGETYGLYSFGNSYTVSTAALQPDGVTVDPFAGQSTTILPTNASIGDSLVANGDGTYSTTDTPEPGSSFVCFCDGTQIMTDRGNVAVEDLCVGDMVHCKDQGSKPIRWIGSRLFRLSEGDDQNLVPIKLERNALGPNRPAIDLYVSPNHCIQLEGSLCDLYFSETEMLFPAKHLVGMTGIYRSDRTLFGYYHILFDDHELIQANGVWTESLFFGDAAKTVMGSDTHNELLSIFPELNDDVTLQKRRLPVGMQFEASVLRSAVDQLDVTGQFRPL